MNDANKNWGRYRPKLKRPWRPKPILEGVDELAKAAQSVWHCLDERLRVHARDRFDGVTIRLPPGGAYKCEIRIGGKEWGGDA